MWRLLWVFSLWKSLKEHLIIVYNYLAGENEQNRTKLFSVVPREQKAMSTDFKNSKFTVNTRKPLLSEKLPLSLVTQEFWLDTDLGKTQYVTLLEQGG